MIKRSILLHTLIFTAAVSAQNMANADRAVDAQNLSPESELKNLAFADNTESTPLLADEQSLRISTTGSVKVSPGGILTVASGINNLGTATNFVLENDANLIQINTTPNTGPVLAKRTVTGLRNIPGVAVDYVYWSSPVIGQQTKGAGGFSPGTPNNYFFDYRESNDRFYQTPDLTFVPGKGYAVRAEDGLGTYTKTYEFKGVPTNGDITFSITRSANTGTGGSVIHGYNLIGNPYPSNIKFDVLFDGNSDLIYKSMWLWTNTTFTPTQQGSGYLGNNYAVYNGTGGNAATKDAAVPSAVVKPTGIVKVGQGFIIQKKNFGPGNLIFKNSYGPGQALRVTTAGTFFSKDEQAFNRFTLQLISPDALVNSLLIGYVPGATDDYEKDYDAEAFTVSSNLFYSLLGDRRLLIQGKADAFNTKDKVVLGANFFQNGTYTIGLDEEEGIFDSGQKVYLKDNITRIITDLTQGNYTFASTAGENSYRFEVIYEPESVLETNDLTKDQLTVYRENSNFVIRSSRNIERVEVYETSGKMIRVMVPNAKSALLEASTLPSGMYLLRIRTADGTLITKKIVR